MPGCIRIECGMRKIIDTIGTLPPESLPLLAAAAGMLLFRTETAAAELSALKLFVDAVLPAMFPQMILAQWFTRRCGGGKGRASLIPILFSAFTAGYPAGAYCLVGAKERGELGAEQAALLAPALVHPGVGFAVLAVGGGMFGSLSVGWLLYAATLLPTLAGTVYGLLKTRKESAAGRRASARLPAGEVLCSSVESAAKACFNAAAWITAFAAFTAVLTGFFPKTASAAALLGEATAGASVAAAGGSVMKAAFCLGFGGFSVFFQLLRPIRAIGVKASRFLLLRLLYGAGAALTAKLLLKTAFRHTAVCASAGRSVRLFVSDPVLTGALVLLTVVFMLCAGQKNHLESRARL